MQQRHVNHLFEISWYCVPQKKNSRIPEAQNPDILHSKLLFDSIKSDLPHGTFWTFDCSIAYLCILSLWGNIFVV